MTHLASCQKKIDSHSSLNARADQSKKLWTGKKSARAGAAAFEEIEEALGRMCAGARRCMYCEDSAACDIEHTKPKSRFPEEAFQWPNYLWACSICNSRYKGAQYPEGFMDPSASDFDLFERWRFVLRTGQFLPLDGKDFGAQATLDVLGFTDSGRDYLLLRRQNYVRILVALTRDYAKAKKRGNNTEARQIAACFCDSFSSIAEWLLTERFQAEDIPESFRKGLEDVRKVLLTFPEIVTDVFPELAASNDG